MADQTDPISAPPADPDIFEPAPRALHVRPWAIAAAGGVVMIRGVSRDFQLNRGCRILRRLHHVQHRRVETIRLIQRRRYWAGMPNAVGTLLVTVIAAAAGLAVAGLRGGPDDQGSEVPVDGTDADRCAQAAAH